MAKKRYHSRGGGAGARLARRLEHPAAPYLCAVLFLFVVLACYDLYVAQLKWVVMGIMVFALAAAILRFDVLKERFTLPLWVLAAYVLSDLLATLYAAQTGSGKLALYAFLIIPAGFSLALALTALDPGEGQASGRWMAAVLAAYSGAAGLVSIDLISTRVLSAPVMAWLRFISIEAYENFSGLEAGARMVSIFGNPNVFAGVSGLAVLLSLGLASTEEGRGKRRAWLALLYVNSLAFVLAFSMGGTAMIVLAFLAFLLLERKERRMGTLVLMLETLVLTMIAAILVSMTSLTRWTGPRPIPLLCAVVGAAALCALDQLVGTPLTRRLAGRTRLVPIAIAAVFAVLAGYVAAGLTLTGGMTLQSGEALRRAAYPDPGEYTLTVESSGALTVTIESQDRQETMMHTSTTLYSGPAADASFTVPEGSQVVYFTFRAGEAAKFDSASYSGAAGSGSLPLDYKLLPGFIANRLQGLFANENAIQRVVFFEDGMKIFRRSPVFGVGMSGFENGFRSVQSFWYVTQNVHNHYIEALVDKGVVGLVIFLALLGVSAAAVWFERRKKEQGNPLVPALGAALVFMAAHGAVEVVFSSYEYLPIAFGVIAIIGAACGPAIPFPRLAKRQKTALACAPLALLAVVVVLLTGNMYAQSFMESTPTFGALESAASLDAFEWEDYALSYVVNAVGSGLDEAGMERAEHYARRLEKLDSITSSFYLASYYFQTGRQEQGFAMLEKYVTFVASDESKWQESFELLMRFDDGTESYHAGARRIIRLLDDWNAENMGEITLGNIAQTYVDTIKGMG